MIEMNLANGWKELAALLTLPALNGNVLLLALSGLFTLSNAPLFAFALMAGPGAMLLASTLDGAATERVLSAGIAGIIATVVLALVALFGPRLLGWVNLNLLKIFGGIAVGLIALTITGLKIPSKIPIALMILGFIIAALWR